MVYIIPSASRNFRILFLWEAPERNHGFSSEQDLSSEGQFVIGSLATTRCWATRRTGPQELSVCLWSLDRVKTMNNMKGKTLTLIPDGRGPCYLKPRNPCVVIMFEVVCFSVFSSVKPRNVVCRAAPVALFMGIYVVSLRSLQHMLYALSDSFPESALPSMALVCLYKWASLWA